MTTQQARAATAKDRRERGALVRQSSALMPYRTPAELAEAIYRFKAMVPGAARLEDPEIQALAQACLAHGLNPIIGEAYWVNGFMVGIRGLRRKGREQLGEDRPNFRFEQLVDDQERQALAIPEGALAFVCVGTTQQKALAHTEVMRGIREALGPDAPWEVVLEQAGPRPETVGIGYITREQMDQLDHPTWAHECKSGAANTSKRYWNKKWVKVRELVGPDPCPDCNAASRAQANAYPHAQRARKRAEAHWWKQECDLPFDFQPGDTLPDEVGAGSYIDGEWREIEEPKRTRAEMERELELDATAAEHQEEVAQRSPEEQQAYVEEGQATLFGEPEDKAKGRARPGFWPRAVLRAAVEEGLAKNEFEAAGRLAKSSFPGTVARDPALVWLRAYAVARDEGGASEQAAALAEKAWIEVFTEQAKAKKAGGKRRGQS